MENLPSQKASYADLFIRLLEGVFLVSMETYEVFEANEASEKITGIAQDQFIGKSLLNWIPESERDSFEKILRMSKRRFYPRLSESRMTITEGKMIDVSVAACVLKLADETEVLQVVLQDITEAKQAKTEIAKHVSELEILNKKLEELSTTDEMTGLHNFRTFKREAQEEQDRAIRFKREYALVFFDVDNFKHYNDTNGHPAGDALLKELAVLAKPLVRNTDLLARYGGEEFIVLCREVGWEGAMVLAERIRAAIEKHQFPHAAKQPLGKVSVSIGVASFPAHGETPDAVKEAADQAMYHSKRSGRNRVTAFGSFTPSEKSN